MSINLSQFEHLGSDLSLCKEARFGFLRHVGSRLKDVYRAKGLAAAARKGVGYAAQPFAKSRALGAQVGAGVGGVAGGASGAYEGYQQGGMSGALRKGFAGAVGGAAAGGIAGGVGAKQFARNLGRFTKKVKSLGALDKAHYLANPNIKRFAARGKFKDIQKALNARNTELREAFNTPGRIRRAAGSVAGAGRRVGELLTGSKLGTMGDELTNLAIKGRRGGKYSDKINSLTSGLANEAGKVKAMRIGATAGLMGTGAAVAPYVLGGDNK